ncbi:MAG: IS630 family transposase [Methanothrix sp.]|nr:IS630 family transposase [Methanothrix sp.]MCX8207005.1 IS630 family transposase [Methanothrix sp.]
MKGVRLEIQNAEEIPVRLRDEKDDRVKARLVFLNAIANYHIDFESACAMCGIVTSTGYLWIRKWNKEGYEGIKDKENAGGRPPRLSEDDLKLLRKELEGKEYWSTKEVREKIHEIFGVSLSEDQVVRILRNKLGMLFSKPFPVDYRRPDDAEAILENQLSLVFSLLRARGIRDEEIAIGFVDETRPQNTPNTVRVWSFEKVRSIKNTTKFETNTIGFYAIKGTSVQKFLENSKAGSIASFFEDVKAANSDYKAIVAIVDNFASHKSKIVKNKVAELGIYLVYLPPYSPDLNPIEFIWKSIKRLLSVTFVKNLEDAKRIISEGWARSASYLSYAKAWIQRFLRAVGYTELCG